MHSPVDHRQGLVYGVSAYLCWALFPLYWPLLKPANAIEILAHRMLWSLVFIGIVVVLTGKWRGVRAIVADRPKLLRLTVAAVCVSVNWCVYIWAVNAEHVVETSLGYFINPLLTILVGVVLLKESFRRMQWVAVGIASLAIAVLTVDYGRPPWIALALATSFCAYGFLKKQVGAGAVESLAVETGVLALPAMIALTVLAGRSELTFGHHGNGNTLLLLGTGVVTAVPLMLFGASAKRLPLTVLGLLQYLTPVIQFGIGVVIRHEPMPPARVLGFGLVWVALLVLTVEGIRQQRRGYVLAHAADSVAV
jgi:chloramphenicol-sensitive protein RarD